MPKEEILWHVISLKEISEHLSADFHNGLNEEEIEKKQKQYGKNIFDKKEKFYYLKLLWKQIKNPLVFILIIAGLITITLREYASTIIIFIAIFINTFIGIFQEGRSSRAFEKLSLSQKKYATVIRGGRQKIIESSELVPGDIIVLQMGDQVPADSRLIEEKGLEINESILTGEWVPIVKDVKKRIKETARIGEKTNMVWMDSLVTEGWARAVVVSTGFNTEIGKIAKFISEEDRILTPLQKGLNHLARFLGIITVFALMILFFVGIWEGRDFFDMLLTSVALAVSAIPEGLPVAFTVVLVIGMQKILSKDGLVKNLNSVETLGSTSVILTDKTGTLTKGEMQVSKIITFISESKEFKEREHKDRLAILQMSLFASQAFIENPEDDLREWIIRGNPMEKAIFLASAESGLIPLDLIKRRQKLDFIPFDSERRYSASLYKEGDQKSRVYIIGAPEVIINSCEKVYEESKEIKLEKKEIKIFNDAYEKEASKGTRVLAVAFKSGDWEAFPQHEKDDGKAIFEKMTLGGFIVFHDPLREDVIDYFKKSKEAFVRTVLVTGDHLSTAKKIAEEVGILSKNGLILTGEDIEKIDDKEIESIIEKVDVFARVLPHQKMRIARAWQKKGEVVAMTGDGVNDAPALRHADIGVALGSGTEVAKEASDLILLKDNFSTIVSAIKEGRRIMDNLRKIIAFLLSTSFSEIILVLAAVLIGAPLPILPTQILWVNIIGEGFMNFAFAFEPAEENVLRRNPKKEHLKRILTPNLKRMIFSMITLTSLLLIVLFFIMHYLHYPIEKARTIMFAAITMDAIFFSFSLKNLRRPIWKINLFSNPYLIFSLSISVILLISALFLSPLQKLLSLTPLNSWELLVIFAIGILNLAFIETAKYFEFKKE